MCRSSRLGRCASLRIPGERQNGEPKAGNYNAPQRRGPRDLQIGPSEAIQRMFVLGHLPLPLDLVESFEAPFCRQRRRFLADQRVKAPDGMTAYSVIVWGAPRGAHVPSETPS